MTSLPLVSSLCLSLHLSLPFSFIFSFCLSLHLSSLLSAFLPIYLFSLLYSTPLFSSLLFYFLLSSCSLLCPSLFFIISSFQVLITSLVCLLLSTVVFVLLLCLFFLSIPIHHIPFPPLFFQKKKMHEDFIAFNQPRSIFVVFVIQIPWKELSVRVNTCWVRLPWQPEPSSQKSSPSRRPSICWNRQ